jgi:antirestriction protein ArdC
MQDAVHRFNGLGGTTVTRANLNEIAEQAYNEQSHEIVNRVIKILEENPEAEQFEIKGVKPIQTITETELQCLCNETHEDIQTGLGKPVSPQEIYDLVTNLMLNTIKEVGHLPWQKEWTGNGEFGAMNYVTGKPYTGINYLLLNFPTQIVNDKRVLAPNENKSPYYLTFNQIESLGVKLKQGSKGHEVVYYNFILNYKDENNSFTSTDANKFEEFVKANNITPEQVEAKLSRFPILKYYKVFSADDCEGLKPKSPKLKQINPIEIAQKIIDGYPNKPGYVFGTDRAFYTPSKDVVSMPNIPAFSSEATYYSTFFHEIVHSTGHKKRLSRDMSGSFGNAAYAFEELIAELGAVYLSSEAGILFHTRNNSAKYLRGWNSRLVKKMQDDNRFFMRAAAEAQKAANYILGDKEHLYTVPTIKVVKPKTAKKLIEKKTKKELAEINPKAFAIKPKSVSVQTAINDILTLNKFKGKVKPLIANLLYKLFKDDYRKTIISPSEYEAGVLKKDGHFHSSYNGEDLVLTSEGEDFIKAVNGRLESLKNQKNNYALFDGLNAPKDSEYNRSLMKAIKRGVKPTDGFVVGVPAKELAKHVPGFPISLSGSVLMKAVSQKTNHNLNYGNFFNLIDYLNNPIAIFKSKTVPKNGFVVLTEIYDVEKKPIMIALHVKTGRKNIEIASMYVRNNVNTYKDWIKEGIDLYINKKSDLFSFQQATIAIGENKSQNKDSKKGLNAPTIDNNILPTAETIQITHEIMSQPQGVGYVVPSQPVQQIPLVQPEVVQPTQNNVVTTVATQNVTQVEKPIVKNKLMQMKFDSLDMDEGWDEFMQSPSKNMKVAIFGKPKNGKSAGSLQLTSYLTKFGKVLYNFADQGFNKSTQDLWRNAGLDSNANAEPSDITTLDELEKEIATGKYSFVFIDMISDYIFREGIKPFEFKDRFIKKYPNVSFILIFEVNKDGNFKGDQGWMHIVDQIVEVENFLMETRGRYGVGHHIVWEEGFKKFNPKKWQEIQETETENITITHEI